MPRLGNARTILEIEAIVGGLRTGAEQFHWETHDVECQRWRHRYSASDYSWTIDVLSIRQRRAGQRWHLILVSELWRAGETNLRAMKWLKVTSGRAADVAAWVAACRGSNSDRAIGATTNRRK